MDCFIKLLYSKLCFFLICSAQNTTNNNIRYNFLRHTIKDIPLIYKKFYHTNDIYKFIDNVQIKNTDFVEVSTIGYTEQGTPLKIIQIKPDINFNNYDIIWIDGGTHAREWISISSVIYIANELIYNRHNLPLHMRNIHYVLMPIVNPDGYTYAYEKERLWRKNRFKTHNEHCIGIDLNRNWNFNWNNTNSYNNACSETYRGPTPNSELEIKSIIQFIMKNLIRLKGFITFHSYGQTIMYPWAYTKVNLKDYKEHHNIAISMALQIFEKTSKTYTVGSASTIMYKVSGTSIDWMKGIANIKYVFAIELRDEGVNGFNLPASEIVPTGQEAFCAVSILVDNVASNYDSNIYVAKLHKLFFILCFSLSI